MEEAKPELLDCIQQLKVTVSQEDTDDVLLNLHKLIPVLHLYKKSELKDEVLILEAIITKNQEVKKSNNKLQLLIKKLEDLSASL